MASNVNKQILLPYQRRWIEDSSPLKIWLAARQVGKSFTLAAEAVLEASERKCDNLILSSSERQAREVMQKVLMHLAYLNIRTQEGFGTSRASKDEVRLLNGSRILCLPANPDTVRGFSGNVFLDEFAFHSDSEEIWRAMYPTVTRGYKVRVSSTPNGKLGMFYQLWSKGENFARHKVDIHLAAAEGLKVDVDVLRAGIGEPEAWAQEFECTFLDESTAYLPYAMISACEDPEAISTGGYEHGRSNKCYLGVDVGRSRDLTVLWLLERVGDVLWTRAVKEMSGAPFSAQRSVLYSFMDGAGVRRAALDSSGIGAQLAEEAREAYGERVEPVTFTASVKEDLAVTARRHFEERTVRVPKDKAIKEDLHSIRRSVTSAGNTRFEAARAGGSHADRFWALALALHAASEPQAELRYESLQSRGAGLRADGCW